jgi:hypothetical protein
MKITQIVGQQIKNLNGENYVNKFLIIMECIKTEIKCLNDGFCSLLYVNCLNETIVIDDIQPNQEIILDKDNYGCVQMGSITINNGDVFINFQGSC